MPRIKIEDLPVLEDLSTKKTKGIFGGISYTSSTDTKNLTLIDESSVDRFNYKIAPDDGIEKTRALDTDTGEFDEKDVEER